MKTMLVAALLLGAGSTGTYAYWSDEVTVEGTTITSGTLDLAVDDDPDDAIVTTELEMLIAVPGDSTAADFTVKNTGSVHLRYHLDAQVEDSVVLGLGGTLNVRVTEGTASGATPDRTCQGVPLKENTSFGPGLIAPTELAPGATQTICIQATVPDAAPQGATTAVTLLFEASSL